MLWKFELLEVWGLVGNGPSLALGSIGRLGHVSLAHNDMAKLAAAAHGGFCGCPDLVRWVGLESEAAFEWARKCVV